MKEKIVKDKVETSSRLELRIVNNQTIRCQGQLIELSGSKDAAVLVLITTLGRTILSEEIVAVTSDSTGFLRLLAYARQDGGITLNRDLG